MSVRARLVVIIVAVALAPLVVSGLLAMRVHQAAFDRQLAALHQSRAQTGAARVSGALNRALETQQILVARTIRWSELTPDERQGALALVYRQHSDVMMVSLLDGKGAGVGEAIFRPSEDSDPGSELRDHPMATIETLAALSRTIPFAAAQVRGRAVGEPFVDASGTALTALAFSIPNGGGKSAPPFVVAVGFSFRSICNALRADADQSITSVLVNRENLVLCGAGVGTPLPESPELFTASARLPGGWRVVTREPRAQAFLASRTLERQNMVLLAASAFVALLVGLVLGRRITRPLAQLTDGARALARGELEHRVAPASSDELGVLADAFAHMAVEIEKREVAIKAFNAELQARVIERTRELEETQAQLLQSQKIAAVASLGAGFAHEINNPLTSVLGFAQILRMRATKDKRDKDVNVLEMVESEAQRIQRIVETLRTFSAGYAGESFVEVDANRCIEAALAGARLDELVVVRDLDGALPTIVGNPAQLEEALRQLVKNAVIAMNGKGTLTIRSGATDGIVKIEVVDTGRGIAPEHLGKIFDPFFTTKDDWRGEGLGLTVVHRIVEQHHGRVRAHSQLGVGATFTMMLPAATRRAHLD